MSNTLLLLFLNRMGFLKATEAQMLRNVISLENLVKLQKTELEALLSRSLRRVTWDPYRFLRQAECDEKALRLFNISYMVYDEKGYPELLKEIDDPPFLIFYRGNLTDSNWFPIAIVGTRHPTQIAEQVTFELASELAQRGVLVVSGLAFGIDRQAHRGALLHGRTWAWLASSVENITPKQHTRLAHTILESGGLILSEYPPKTSAMKYQFFKRNRLISGMSRAVVLMQAPLKSGAMITARYAIAQNRELLVHPVGFHPTVGTGGLSLVDQGCPTISTAENILKEVGLWTRTSSSF